MAFDWSPIALQSLKEFYEDQRGKYQSPTELEMRVYHRLIHIRDQKERHDDIPEHIQSHPVFKLTTDFRLHVQKHSAPITKTSKLVVTDEGMQLFSNLAAVLIEQGNTVMVYLVACVLERLFGKDTIEDIESLRGHLTIPEIIDGTSTLIHPAVNADEDRVSQENDDVEVADFLDEPELQIDADGMDPQPQPIAPAPLKPTSPQWLANGISGPSTPAATTTTSTATATGNAFAGLVSQSHVTGTTNVFGSSIFSVSASKPAASVLSSPQNIFGGGSIIPVSQSSAIPHPPSSNPFPGTATAAKPSQPIPVLPTPTNIFGQHFTLDSFHHLSQNFRCK